MLDFKYFTTNEVRDLANKERTQIQNLNYQLEIFLDNVKILDDLNKKLKNDIKIEESTIKSELSSVKLSLESDLKLLEHEIEKNQNDLVDQNSKIVENESLKLKLSKKIDLLKYESKNIKQNIFKLEFDLCKAEIDRVNLLRQTQHIKEEIDDERHKTQSNERDLFYLRSILSDVRQKNFQYKNQIRNLSEMIQLEKRNYFDELKDIEAKSKILKTDLSLYYRKELDRAIEQISHDFRELSQKSIEKFKQHQDVKLLKIQEDEKKKTEIYERLRLQNDELKTCLNDLKLEFMSHVSEEDMLVSKFNKVRANLIENREKVKLKLENSKLEEENLRNENNLYINKIEDLKQVKFIELDSELITFKCIVNSQLKLIESDIWNSYPTKVSNNFYLKEFDNMQDIFNDLFGVNLNNDIETLNTNQNFEQYDSQKEINSISVHIPSELLSSRSDLLVKSMVPVKSSAPVNFLPKIGSKINKIEEEFAGEESINHENKQTHLSSNELNILNPNNLEETLLDYETYQERYVDYPSDLESKNDSNSIRSELEIYNPEIGADIDLNDTSLIEEQRRIIEEFEKNNDNKRENNLNSDEDYLNFKKATPIKKKRITHYLCCGLID